MNGQISRVTVEVTVDDGMSGTRWEFFFLDSTLVVDGYLTWAKATKRHKGTVKQHWSRLNGRDSTIHQSEVPLSEEVSAEAKRKWLAQLERLVSVGFQRR